MLVQKTPVKPDLKRIVPISSLRFVLASWVVFSHYRVPVLDTHQQGLVLWGLRALVNNLMNGPAAVIVFFIISGFCIHYPNRNGLAMPSWKLYYARRYLRILIPMTVAIGFSVPLKMQFGLFTDSILWSLLCEEIYYLIYPCLLAVRDRLGWNKLMAIAWGLALVVILTNPRAGDYASYGAKLNWVLGLPCWLLGCRLAERMDRFSGVPVSRAQIWSWRGGAWALSIASSILRFHSPIGGPWTVSLFAIYASSWLEREIRYYRSGRRAPRLENLGEASYSIYLTHTHGPALLHMLGLASLLSPAATWAGEMVLCAGFAGLFFVVVEKPSHRLARRVARQPVLQRAAAAAAAR